jgi:hypothetical protein
MGAARDAAGSAMLSLRDRDREVEGMRVLYWGIAIASVMEREYESGRVCKEVKWHIRHEYMRLWFGERQKSLLWLCRHIFLYRVRHPQTAFQGVVQVLCPRSNRVAFVIGKDELKRRWNS